MTRQEAEKCWNNAWDAATETEQERRLLAPDEGFACNPKEWCFDIWCWRVGLPPRPVVQVPTTSGLKEMHWDEQKQTYEEAKGDLG